MKVENMKLFHFHNNDVEWKNNKILVDDNYNANFIYDCLDLYDEYKRKNNLCDISDEESLNDFYLFLNELEKDFDALNVFEIIVRELGLENYRINNCRNLPSRMHSMYLCDFNSLDYWMLSLQDNCELYEMNLNGNIFRSNASFLPQKPKSIKRVEKNAFKYWNPKNERNIELDEYLFQGTANIIRKIDISEYRKELSSIIALKEMSRLFGNDVLIGTEITNNDELKLIMK